MRLFCVHRMYLGLIIDWDAWNSSAKLTMSRNDIVSRKVLAFERKASCFCMFSTYFYSLSSKRPAGSIQHLHFIYNGNRPDSVFTYPWTESTSHQWKSFPWWFNELEAYWQ